MPMIQSVSWWTRRTSSTLWICSALLLRFQPTTLESECILCQESCSTMADNVQGFSSQNTVEVNLRGLLELDKSDLSDLVKTYRIPLDLYPCLPDIGFTMDRLPADAIGIYSEFLWFFGIRLNKVVSFEVVCRDLNIVPTVTLFRVFKCLRMDDGPSSLKKWKDKFFLIDRRAIPDYLTWRHSCSCVSDDLPSDGYDRDDVQRLCARLIYLCEMREEVLVRSRLSSVWFNKECDPVFRSIDDNAVRLGGYNFCSLFSDAKIVEGSHHLSLSLLECVPSHTTAPASKCAIIPLHTPDEIAASLPDPRLAKNSKGPSLAKGVNEADLADLCVELEDSLERDKGVSTRAVSAPIPRLGKRLGVPPSIVVASVSEPSHVETSPLLLLLTVVFLLEFFGAIASGRAGMSGAQMDVVMHRQMDPLDCLSQSALARDVEYDQIPDDDFGTNTCSEE
ncbi:hypothetical protein Tco_1250058, partial [Tanacetum coccineum]